MPAYRHVIWDWNGTLFDDSWLCIEIMNDLLSRHGHPRLERERYEAIFTIPVRLYYARAGFVFDETPYEDVGTEWFLEYERRLGECSLQRGAEDTLAALSEGGFSQSLLSALRQDTLDRLVDGFGLRPHFLGVVGIDDHLAEGKIEHGRRWIERVGVPRQEILFVGDTGHDAEVAAEMGVDCVLIPSGHASQDRLARTGLPVLASVADVKGLLEGHPS